MSCCPTTNNVDLSLLRLILQIVREIDRKIGVFPQNFQTFDSNENQEGAQAKTIPLNSVAQSFTVLGGEINKTNKMVGIDAFPITAPATPIIPEKLGMWEKIFDFIKPDETVKIKSLAELVAWAEANNDARQGQWHQSIKVEDGGEEVVVLPDMAQAIKEVVILQSETIKTLSMVLDICMKTLMETSSTKVQASRAYMLARDIQEYLDYETVQKSHQVPLQISVPVGTLEAPPSAVQKTDVEEFLKPGMANVVTDEYSGKMSLSDTLLEVQQAVAMIRANFFRKSA